MEVVSTTSPAVGVTIKPNTIKAAQEEMGRLDVLLCGQCHAVFHFIEEFQQHRSKEGACSKVSNFRENNTIEQKAQVWAFLLWKDTQNQLDSPDKESKEGSWKLYQKWCKMDNHTRDGWILAGKTIQTFTKISNAKMQDVPQIGSTEGGKTVVLRKVIRNGQPDSPDKKPDIKIKTETFDSKLKSPVKSKAKSMDDDNLDSDDEYFVEQIMAKRFNPKRKVYEYLLKWKKRNSTLYSKDNYNTWEDVAHVSEMYKHLMDDFESNLAKQKEIKAQQVAKSIPKANQLGSSQKKLDNAKAGPSTPTQGGRPMRVSKTKATDQMKKWCGSMRDDDLFGKRKLGYDSDSDDEDIGASKRNKVDTSGEDDDEEWASDSQDDKTLIGRRDVIQRAFRGANLQSNGSRGGELVNNRGTKIEVKPSASQTNVYVVHKKEGIIKLDSSPTNKLSVKGPSNQTSTTTTAGGMLIVRSGGGSNATQTNVVRKQVVATTSVHGQNAITPVKVMTKADGTQVITQMQVVASSKGSPAIKAGAGGVGGTLTTVKSEPVKIQPRPDLGQVQQIQFVTAIPNSMGMQTQRVVTTSTPQGRASVGQQRTEGVQRPLLPRPNTTTTTTTTTGNRTSTPLAQNRTVQARGAQQQRPVVQKRIVPSSSTTTTLLQTSTPGVLPTTPKSKVTVVNAHGKVMNSPALIQQQQQQPKPSPKGTPVNKAQQGTQQQPEMQKMMQARKKLAAEAGVVPKPVGGRANARVVRGKAATNVVVNRSAKVKETKLVATGGLHMVVHEKSEESSSEEAEPEFPPLPAVEHAQACPEPESPTVSLCPHTGRLIGPDGKPIEQPEPEPAAATPATNPTPMAIVSASAEGAATATMIAESNEVVLPTLESFSDGAGGIVRVEMSPGGTTGIVVQTSEAPTSVMPGPDMPSLDGDPSVEIQTTSAGEVVVNVAPIAPAVSSAPDASLAATSTAIAEATTTTATTTAPTTTISAEQQQQDQQQQEQDQQQVFTADSSDAAVLVPKEEVASGSVEAAAAESTAEDGVKLEENAGLVTITGEDGVLYQVAGQSVNGQTLLVAQGADGAECVYVTTAEQGATGEDGSVLTLEHAVAEAVAQLAVDPANPQYYAVKDGATGEGVEAAEVAGAENQQLVVYNTDQVEENDNQVVAQVISAEEPGEDGSRKVVLLLPDGNMMMTEVNEEQYAALELDK